MRLPALAFDYWGLLMPECEAALNGQQSAETALKNAGDRISDKLSEG
jgi:hypothetical protein